MMMAINGAWVVAAKKQPMPTITYKCALAAAPGKAATRPCWYSNPNTAPTNSVGANTPPTAPEPTVTEIARALATNTNTSACQCHESCNMAATVVLPLPHTSGVMTDRQPSSNPPMLN